MSPIKHFLFLFAQFFLVWSSKSNELVNEFAVHIPGPPELADRVAAKYGFINKGQVGSLQGYYRFVHNGIEKRSLIPNKYYQSLLLNDSKVHWCEQQIIRKRVKRVVSSEGLHFSDPLYSEQWFLHSDYGGYDMNVEPAWARGYTGKGSVVTILDDGIQGSHPDLALNYDKEASWDINDDDDDPTPKDDGNNKHGTRCAGEVAAVANNEFCGVGVAYNSRIGGVRMLDGRVTDTIEATALSFKVNHIHIYSASWGPEDDGKTVDGPGPLAKIAFENGIKKGRNGLGSIFVWASGNGGKLSDSCNCDGYTNSIYTISVSSATESGYKPWYLEECSSTLATTYSSGTTSTDRDIVTVDVNYDYIEKLKNGGRPNPNSLCTKKHTGTSASAPIAAGLCALALEANPALTWRDMQYIIVITSRYIPLSKEDGWITNGVNRNVSTKFGYGLMDGDAMVKVAAKWKTVDEQHICSTPPDEIKRPIPKRKGEYVEAVILTDGCKPARNFVRYAEHVQVRVTLSFHPRGNLHIILVSPKNTTSSLLFPRPHDAEPNQDSFDDWPFMSVHFWGEEITGPWKLIIHNAGKNNAQHSGTLVRWSITFYGTEYVPDCVKHNNCLEDKKSEEQHSEKPYFQVRGVTVSTHVTAEICKDSNKFLHVLSSSNKHCVSTCPPGFYASTKDYLCHKCDESCSSCYGPFNNNCLTCLTSQYLQNSTCINKCPDGYLSASLSTMNFEVFHQCVPCADSCLTCEEEIYKCNSCKEGFYLVQHQCLTHCPSGTYKKDKCLSCSPGCTSCYGGFSDNCLACSSGYYLIHHSCETACPLRYFADNKGRCIPCHRSCETCVSQSHCLTCVEEKYQRRENEGLCEAVLCDPTTECPSSECFVSDCAICLQAMSCEACKENSLWWYGKCIRECPVSDYVVFDECRNCGGMCSSCVGNPYHCTSCQDGFYLHQNNCYPICPVGYFGTNEWICKTCHPTCEKCSGPTELQCVSCPAENYLLNGSCISSCHPGYYPVVYSINHIDGFQEVDIHSGYETIEVRVCKKCHVTCETCSEYGPHFCTSCFEDRTLTDNTCMPCLYGDFFNYYEKVCQNCDPHCSTCFGPSDVECSSCTPPLRLHKEKHICLPCCLSETGEDCCMCNNNNSDHCVIPQQRSSWQVATVVTVIVVVVIILFIIVFTILQYRQCIQYCHRILQHSSKRSRPYGFRGRNYIPVPRELNATFNVDQEKVCLTQEDADEEDEIFLKT